ncbi:MAG TPA: ferritin-like domain-containing protein [Pyrinomonadaceae bacterium]|jgi:starvation-inducible DNA-binding protein
MIRTTDKLSKRTHTLIKLCNDRLADAVDLQLQCKHAYWNTRDPNLVTLRETFDQLNESVEDYVDRIADRCVKIGGVANSTERVLATWWHLLCSPDAVCRNHARVIATALESFGELLRQTTDTANEFGDFESAEMFTEISDGVEKWHLTLVTS